MSQTPDDVLTACSGPAILSLDGDGVNIDRVDLPDEAAADRYHDWCQQHQATIVQQLVDEYLICAVVGCMSQATHAVVEFHHDAACTEVTSCPDHLAGVILTAFGLLDHSPQRPVWN